MVKENSSSDHKSRISKIVRKLKLRGETGNYLKSFDQLGDEFSMNFGSEEKHRTDCGGCMSITVFILVMYSSYNFFSQLLDTTQVEVSTSRQFTDQYPKMNLYEGKMLPVIGLEGGPESLISPDEIHRYVNIQAVVLQFNYTKLSYKDFNVSQPLKVEYVPCRDLNDSTLTDIYKDFENARDYVGTYGMCPNVTDPDEFYVEGQIFAPPRRQFNIFVFPCAGEKADDCAEEKEFKNLVVNFILPSPSFDPENYENPITIFPSSDTYVSVNPQASKRINLKLKKTEIYDDRFDLVGEKLKEEVIDVDTTRSNDQSRSGETYWCTYEQVNAGNCTSFVEMEISSGGTSIVIVRSYMKILTIIGEMGGANDAMLVFVGILFLLWKWRNNPGDTAIKTAILQRKNEEDVMKYIEFSKERQAITKKWTR